MKSVCLVIPPSAFLLNERVFVSLGVLRVASSLEDAGHSVTVVDLSGVENYQDAMRAYLLGATPDVIGVTVTTPQLPSAMDVMRVVREVSPAVRLVLGGPHVTLTQAAVKVEMRRGVEDGRASRAWERLSESWDVLVAGDGELAVHAAIADDAPSVIDGDDHRGPYFMSDAVYEETRGPARDLVDLGSYHYEIDGHNATTLIGQLGCPFRCGFCGGRNSKSLRMIRTRSVDSIMSEIDELFSVNGYTGFMFYDDELNVSKNFVPMLREISAYQERHGVEFRLRGFVKSELFTEEQAVEMYRAGFRWLLCGFEAADEGILVNIDKRATVADNTRTVRLAKGAGLKVKALMSVGHAGESRGSIESISKWLVDERVDDFDCTVITCYPGTPYYDMAVPHDSLDGVWTYTHRKTGARLHLIDVDYTESADYYKGDPDDGYKAFVFTDYLTSDEIVTLRNDLESSVRGELGIPPYSGAAALRYEHSMGQGLPEFVVRATK